MAKRERLEDGKGGGRLPASSGGQYFAAPKTHLEFISSGCTLLDCVLGGGWPLGRIANVVGDKSTGKTLLAIEACANFAAAYPKGHIYYRESEAAFDIPYAKALGMPVDRVKFGSKDKPIETVEQLFEDLEKRADWLIESNEPGLYILDSLDALSDKEEQHRKIDDGSYKLNKAKMMGELFRRLVRKIERSRMCIIIISQVRDKIGATMGEKTTRTGGRALDFYASQVVKLSHIQTIKRTVSGIKRPTGIRIKVKCTKNKIGLPLREAEFEVLFGYGIDDLGASVDWLMQVKALKEAGITEDPARYLARVGKMTDVQYFTEVQHAADAVRAVWQNVETSFLPTRRKYQ